MSKPVGENRRTKTSPGAAASMQHLAAVLTVLCAVLTGGRGLTCFSCMDSRGRCPGNAVCHTVANQSCTTTLVTRTIGGNLRDRMDVQSCGTCGAHTSYNTGYMRLSTHSRCCDHDRCNGRKLQVSDDTALNGMVCLGCFNRSSEACNSATRLVQCVGPEYYCFHQRSTDVTTGQVFVAKGCASESVCRAVNPTVYGVQTSSNTHCCKSSMCNIDKDMSGLRCRSQLGAARPMDIHCSSKTCRSVRIIVTTGSGTRRMTVRGCGGCEGPFSFNSGSVSLHVSDYCCNKQSCNVRSVAEVVNTTVNGLECSGCVGSVQECNRSTETVKCVGDQGWCIKTVDTLFPLSATAVFRGCSSASLCHRPGLLASTLSLHSASGQGGLDNQHFQSRCDVAEAGHVVREGRDNTGVPMGGEGAVTDVTQRPMVAQTVGGLEQGNAPMAAQGTVGGIGVIVINSDSLGLTVTGGGAGSSPAPAALQLLLLLLASLTLLGQ